MITDLLKKVSYFKNFSGSRRDFFIASAALVFLGGCASMPRGLKENASGFDLYANNSFKVGFRIWKTWNKHLVQYGYAHTGTAYEIQIVRAMASGTVVLSQQTHIGYTSRDSGARVWIVHEAITETEQKMLWYENPYITTWYWHMGNNSSKVEVGDWVERGQIIGTGGAPNNYHVKTCLLMNDKREQANNYGLNMGPIDPWDGTFNLDIPPEIAKEKKHKQYNLIKELLERYNGPNKKDLTGHTRALVHKGARSSENTVWSITERFKLCECIFHNKPEIFKGTYASNKKLIKDIRDNQPIFLSAPF